MLHMFWPAVSVLICDDRMRFRFQFTLLKGNNEKVWRKGYEAKSMSLYCSCAKYVKLVLNTWTVSLIAIKLCYPHSKSCIVNILLLKYPHRNSYLYGYAVNQTFCFINCDGLIKVLFLFPFFLPGLSPAQCYSMAQSQGFFSQWYPECFFAITNQR